jgi:hypothetical protein
VVAVVVEGKVNEVIVEVKVLDEVEGLVKEQDG